MRLGHRLAAQLARQRQQLLAPVACRVVEHELHQPIEDGADPGSGLDAELALDVVAVDREPVPDQQIGRPCQLEGDAPLELGLALLAGQPHAGGGIVGPTQREQERDPGLAHAANEAPNGRVGPRGVVRVHVMADGADGRRGQGAGHAETVERVGRQLRADPIVTDEVAVGQRGGLADVVEQRGQPERAIACRRRVDGGQDVV